MDSIWSTTASGRKHESLKGDIKTQAAVIGAGLAGILIAHFLQQSGVETIVLEGSRVGSGQTKNTTAKITSQHDLIYDKLIKHFGVEKARQYAYANQKAIYEFRHIIKQKGIDCDYSDTDCYLYSVNGTKSLKPRRKLQKPRDCRGDEVQNRPAVQYRGRAEIPNQGKFHPLKFLFALSDGNTVYENTPSGG